MVVLSIHPGALNAFALRLKEKDSLSGLRTRISKKLSLAEGGADDLVLKYEWVGVLYTLEDGACLLDPCVLSVLTVHASQTTTGTSSSSE
jgi:hypothetical protein